MKCLSHLQAFQRHKPVAKVIHSSFERISRQHRLGVNFFRRENLWHSRYVEILLSFALKVTPRTTFYAFPWSNANLNSEEKALQKNR